MRFTSLLLVLPACIGLACGGGGSNTSTTDTTACVPNEVDDCQPDTSTGPTTEDPTGTPTTTSDTSATTTDTAATTETSATTTDDSATTGTTGEVSVTGTTETSSDTSSTTVEETSSSSTTTGEPACASLAFDGTDDYIEVESLTLPVFTIEAWVRPMELGGQRAFVTQLDSIDHPFTSFELGTEGDLPYFIIGDGKKYLYLKGTASIGAGEWSHVAATYDGTTGRLAVGGKFDAKNVKGTMVQTDIPITIGNRPSQSFLFSGLMSEVRISQTVRHDADFVPALHHTSDADTVALWHLDETMGAVAEDSSGNGHTGDIKGDAMWAAECPG